MVGLHADAVAQNSATGNAAGGIDGQNSHSLSGAANGAYQRVDESALACAWRPSDAGDDGVVGMRTEFSQQAGGFRRVILDGGRRASQRTHITTSDLIDPIGHQSFSSWRAITRRWISLVPSPMVQSFTSR